jgi:hypothetical protein
MLRGKEANDGSDDVDAHTRKLPAPDPNRGLGVSVILAVGY